MNIFSPKRASFAALTALGLFAAVSAHAAVTASTGHAKFAGDVACFQRDDAGRVTNTCAGGDGGRRTWTLGDYISTSGSKSVVVNAYIPGGTSINCGALAVSRTGAVVGSSFRSLTSFGVDANLPAMTVTVPSYGALSIVCDVPQGGRINTVNF